VKQPGAPSVKSVKSVVVFFWLRRQPRQAFAPLRLRITAASQFPGFSFGLLPRGSRENDFRTRGVIQAFSRRRRCQKNGVGKMEAPCFAPTERAGFMMFLTRIFLPSSSESIGNCFCANPWQPAASLHAVGRDRTRQQTHRRPQPAFRRSLNRHPPFFRLPGGNVTFPGPFRLSGEFKK